MGASPLLFWVMLAVICLFLGTFIEIVPVFYLTVPIFAAIALSFDQSLLHLYVVFVAFAGIGMITPPVCVGIYTSAGVVGEDPGKAFSGNTTIHANWNNLWSIDDFFPWASTWLPNILRKKEPKV